MLKNNKEKLMGVVASATMLVGAAGQGVAYASEDASDEIVQEVENTEDETVKTENETVTPEDETNEKEEGEVAEEEKEDGNDTEEETEDGDDTEEEKEEGDDTEEEKEDGDDSDVEDGDDSDDTEDGDDSDVEDGDDSDDTEDEDNKDDEGNEDNGDEDENEEEEKEKERHEVSFLYAGETARVEFKGEAGKAYTIKALSPDGKENESEGLSGIKVADDSGLVFWTIDATQAEVGTGKFVVSEAKVETEEETEVEDETSEEEKEDDETSEEEEKEDDETSEEEGKEDDETSEEEKEDDETSEEKLKVFEFAYNVKEANEEEMDKRAELDLVYVLTPETGNGSGEGEGQGQGQGQGHQGGDRDKVQTNDFSVATRLIQPALITATSAGLLAFAAKKKRK